MLAQGLIWDLELQAECLAKGSDLAQEKSCWLSPGEALTTMKGNEKEMGFFLNTAGFQNGLSKLHRFFQTSHCIFEVPLCMVDYRSYCMMLKSMI